MTFFLTGTAIIAASGIVSFFFNEKHKAIAVSVLSGFGAAMTSAACIPVVFSGGRETLQAGAAVFGMDPLTAFFAVIISVMGFFSAVYSTTYMRRYLNTGASFSSHYFFLPVLIASMLMVTASRDAVSFLFSWEIMALTSFFLVIFDSRKKEVYEAGIYYLVMSHISVALLIAGFAVSGGNGLTFDDIKMTLTMHAGLAVPVFVLFFLGFAIKAGIVPLHTWLPSAHPAAPSHISGLMSGVMIKMGIYGIMRFMLVTSANSMWIIYTMLILGAGTSIFGILFSMTQKDIKRILAYSSVENIGIITMGLALGMLGVAGGKPFMAFLGFSGALLHTLNHSIWKGMLFFGAGTVYDRTHTRDLEHLGGLGRKMPALSWLFFTATAAISGMPVLNGFISEFMIFLAMLEAVRSHSGPLMGAGAFAFFSLALTGAIAVAGFTRLYSMIFSGQENKASAAVPAGDNKTTVVVLSILGFGCFFIGMIPQEAVKLVVQPAMMLAGPQTDLSSFESLSKILRILSMIFIGMAASTAIIFAIKRAALAKKTAVESTWGCGYTAPDARMQYTAYSYAEPVLRIAEPFVEKQKEEVKAEGLFPAAASYNAKYSDVFEKHAVKKSGNASLEFFRVFSWIQSGNTQNYILYGLIFLVLSIIWAIAGGS
jgi:formate hydrogenlyase subunit 3/multisubunit Na+/H+ antiporter MnhD subunit